MITKKEFMEKYQLPEVSVRRLIKEGIVKARKEKTAKKVIRYNKPFHIRFYQVLIDEEAWLDIPTFVRNALTKKIINYSKGQKKRYRKRKEN